jgi:hypothetical protein
MKGYCVLSNAFSAPPERIMWFLFLLLFICCITFMDLCMLNYPCIPGMEPTWPWSWCMIFLTCGWILFTNILLIIFTSTSLFGFGMSVILASRMSLVVFLPFLFPGKVWGVLVLVLL